MPALRMHVEQPLRQLGHLGDAAGDRDARHGMVADVFQHAADEIAHVDQLHLVQAVQLLHGQLGSVAGGAGDMGEAHGAGDVDAAMDGVNPGRAGIGDDDAGRAEDRDAADDAEARVERALGHPVAAGNGNLDLEIGALAGDLAHRPRRSSCAAPG